MDRAIEVAVKSFNRPLTLMNLLGDFGRERTKNMRLTVWDDGSTAPMGGARRLCDRLGFEWRQCEHHGKQRAWQLHNQMYDYLQSWHDAALLLFFDDDMRLCDSFFERLLRAWDSIEDGRAATLHLAADSSRDGKGCWTGRRPVAAGPLVRRTQWLDGSFACSPMAMRVLGWKLQPIPKERWRLEEGRSTGVGEQLSRRLNDAGMGLYQVEHSLAVHVPVPSRYQREVRAAQPLKTIRFVDGEQEMKRLTRVVTQTVAAMATIPEREQHLDKVVDSLIHQVDVLYVYLNGHASTPRCLRGKGKVVVASSRDHGDLGDVGKFNWCERLAPGTVVLSCDDDIVYPPGYARRMLGAIKGYGGAAVVGAHGVLVGNVRQSYYSERRVMHFCSKLASDEPVHVLGTGCMAYLVGTLEVKLADFARPNMADIWFGVIAQRQSVPMVVIAHEAGWLDSLPTAGSIYRSACGQDAEQTAAVLEAAPWRLHRAAAINEDAPSPAPRRRARPELQGGRGAAQAAGKVHPALQHQRKREQQEGRADGLRDSQRGRQHQSEVKQRQQRPHGAPRDASDTERWEAVARSIRARKIQVWRQRG